MQPPIVIEVDLEPDGMPPAAESLRQLLALVDGLPDRHGELEWRLVSVSLNSPVRAELRAYDSNGQEADADFVENAVESAFGVLDALNDNEPLERLRGAEEADLRRLRSYTASLKGENGQFTIQAPDAIHVACASVANAEYLVTTDGGILALDAKVQRRDDTLLKICRPDQLDGPLL